MQNLNDKMAKDQSMQAKSTVSVFIAEDHEVTRFGIRAVIESNPDFKLVGEAADGKIAYSEILAANPDVVLMDLVMPVKDGIEATKEILALFPDMKIIALTSFKESEMVQDVMREGALGYLLKTVSGKELAEAIRSVYRGEPALAPEVTRDFVMGMQQPRTGEDLTEREMEVLKLLVEGMSNPEIADRLVISRSTARAHVSNILAKLQVSNRSEAVALALRKRLVR